MVDPNVSIAYSILTPVIHVMGADISQYDNVGIIKSLRFY